jgi:serine phosphatase RsbU (regulator of sigma subunit)/PAS domain-containing protein
MATTNRRPVMDPESALGFLAQASGVLAGSLDYERTLAEVARLVVPDVADWCAVDVVEADGSLRQITSTHPDPDQEALLMELRRRYRAEKGGSAGATYAILSGEPTLAKDTTGAIEIDLRDGEEELYRRLGPKSYMIVPLTARGRTIGALTLLSTREGRHYTEADLDFAQHLGRRFALAIDNARLYDEAERARAMLDTLFRSVPVGLAMLDSELRVVRANDAISAIAARPAAECVGCSIPALFGRRGDELEPLCRQVLETGEPLLDHDATWGARHYVVSCTPVRAADGSPAGVGLVTIDVTERRRLLERERVAGRRSAFLARAGEVLESSLDYETTLRNVAQLAVPDVADWCAIHMTDDTGAVRLVAVANPDPEREKMAWEFDERYPTQADAPGGPAAVIRTGQGEAHSTVTEDMVERSARDPEHLEALRALGVRSSVIAPLRAGGRTSGAITFVSSDSNRTFTPEDVDLAEEIARRAGLAIENARLYTERSRIAHTLQAELLPNRMPDIPGASVAVRYRAAGELNEVGGDFYDVFERRDGGWALVIGDVSGKGAEAAAVTALARHTVRTAALEPASPSDLLLTLNEALLTQRAGTEFCTVCVAALTPRPDGGALLRVALGGHPPALVLRADGRVEQHGHPGTLIGVFADPALEEVEVDLDPGDVVLLYTDGVTEAGPTGSEIGEDGLAEILGRLVGRSPEQIVAAIERAAVDAQDGRPRDDIALVALRLEPQPG